MKSAQLHECSQRRGPPWLETCSLQGAEQEQAKDLLGGMKSLRLRVCSQRLAISIALKRASEGFSPETLKFQLPQTLKNFTRVKLTVEQLQRLQFDRCGWASTRRKPARLLSVRHVP